MVTLIPIPEGVTVTADYCILQPKSDNPMLIFDKNYISWYTYAALEKDIFFMYNGLLNLPSSHMYYMSWCCSWICLNLAHDIVDISRDIHKPIIANPAVARVRTKRGHSVEHPPLIIVLVPDEGAARVPGTNAAVYEPCAHMAILGFWVPAVCGRHCL